MCRHLVAGDGGGEVVTVEVEVDVGQTVEQFARLPAVLVGVLHLQVLALRATQLLQVEVEHGGQARGKLLKPWQPGPTLTTMTTKTNVKNYDKSKHAV